MQIQFLYFRRLLLLIPLLLLLIGCDANDNQDNEFLGRKYLLDYETSEMLYNSIADLPIIDIHNHADIREIVDNKPWTDIWQVEGETDHYVWELMRKRGVDEELITGKASNKEKWLALAEVMPDLVGNPSYEWIHLDLQRRFQIKKVISSVTAEEIWDRTKLQLEQSDMLPQSLLKEMKVEILCTTDDPTINLPYHEKAKNEIEGIQILPTWRPDKAMKIENKSWKVLVDKLGEETGINTSELSGFLQALQLTHDYFNEMGCLTSDHGITNPYTGSVSNTTASNIHRKAYFGKILSNKEIADYKAFMLCKFGEMNAEKGWVMQLHIGPVRDYRYSLLDEHGPDSGGDISTQSINITDNLQYLLNKFDGKLEIILYCVDPTHLPTLATISRAFPNISLGAPWWFNDSPLGMESHFEYIGTVDLLRNHAGMVTDSRKIISFGSRTEMFRRSISNVIGKMVERGQIPMNEAYNLVKAIVYERPLELFTHM